MQSLQGLRHVFPRSISFQHTSRWLLDLSRQLHEGSRHVQPNPTPVSQVNSNLTENKKFKLHSVEDAETFGTLKQNLERSSLDKGLQTENDKTNLMHVKTPKKGRVSPNTFGTLASDGIAHPHHSDFDLTESDDKQDVKVWQLDRRHVDSYAKEIVQLGKTGKLKEALKMFQQMKDDGHKPPQYIMPVLIGACGRAGYLKMAFALFKEMRDRAYRIHLGVFTSLFNACAETPFPKDGLKRAYRLKEIMTEKTLQPSQITYHAMIKAFGKCGDLQMAFQVADEMKEHRFPITEETYAFLLMACIADKEAGFSHAIQVLWNMHARRVRPTNVTFNLLLRAARDCGVGPPEIVNQMIEKWHQHFLEQSWNRKLIENQHQLLPREESVQTCDVTVRNSLEDKQQRSLLDPSVSQLQEQSVGPNLLLAPPTAYSVEALNFDKIKTADARLSLLGGMEQVLNMMSKLGAKANIKTFTILLESIPSTKEDENALLCAMEKWKVKPDADFLNLLIKKRSYRNDWKAVQATLPLFQHYGKYPDIVTFGVLAVGCSTMNRGKQLLQDMESAGFRPNIEILGALLSQACHIPDFWYVLEIMNTMKKLEIQPDLTALRHLEETIKKTNHYLLKKERGEVVPTIYAGESLCKSYNTFRLGYNSWLLNMQVQKDPHPWEQYQ